jgi:hypothetical protein
MNWRKQQVTMQNLSAPQLKHRTMERLRAETDLMIVGWRSLLIGAEDVENDGIERTASIVVLTVACSCVGQ